MYLSYIATVGRQYLPMLLMGVAKCLLYEVVCYCTAQIGPELVSIVWNSRVSTVEGLWMY